MKKSVIFFIIIIAILGTVWYINSQSKISLNNKIAYNNDYKELKDKEITGIEFASIINKAMDLNVSNQVQKDSKGFYIDNGENSLLIEIKFKDSDIIINAQSVFKNDITKFINIYGNYKFKCTKIEYHNSSKLVKYLYFEEV